MPIKRYTSAEISSKLQQIKFFLATGDQLAAACEEAGVSVQSYYRWTKKCVAASTPKNQQASTYKTRFSDKVQLTLKQKKNTPVAPPPSAAHAFPIQ